MDLNWRKIDPSSPGDRWLLRNPCGTYNINTPAAGCPFKRTWYCGTGRMGLAACDAHGPEEGWSTCRVLYIARWRSIATTFHHYPDCQWPSKHTKSGPLQVLVPQGESVAICSLCKARLLREKAL